MADYTFTELTPTAFLDRSRLVHADRLAIVDGDRSFSYAELGDRADALTGLLAACGVRPGDRVAALCSNSHVMLELHHGVPLRGAVLVPLNTRLSKMELVAIVRHSGARLLVATREYAETAAEVAGETGIDLLLADERGEYEAGLTAATPARSSPQDERSLLAINYTSGTTGEPKGVMYHHRGGYLQSLAMAFHLRLGTDTRYLWTLPMFHCNGWCFTWALPAAGAVSVCLRVFSADETWRSVETDGITHLSAAPTVLTMLHQSPAAPESPTRRVQVTTGGAPPSPALLAKLDRLGMDVTHLYGLTETFGPVVINPVEEMAVAPAPQELAAAQARQGVGNVVADPVRVVDEAGVDVPADAATQGEIVVRGNDVMLGYYNDAAATEAVSLDGWFRTGDLAVMHPDRRVEITDRAKDVVITGGENVASVEVERVIAEHPSVAEVAVVGWPDETWGQVVTAFVTPVEEASVEAAEIVGWAKARLAGFKVPRTVIFGDLPKTSTGKIRKSELRARAGRQER
jgi:fatty-acyl-CoA synthase